ncbi:hypothetical protein JCM8547_007152 [Rhodosporidiobolus lusitaniae]
MPDTGGSDAGAPPSYTDVKGNGRAQSEKQGAGDGGGVVSSSDEYRGLSIGALTLRISPPLFGRPHAPGTTFHFEGKVQPEAHRSVESYKVQLIGQTVVEPVRSSNPHDLGEETKTDTHRFFTSRILSFDGTSFSTFSSSKLHNPFTSGIAQWEWTLPLVATCQCEAPAAALPSSSGGVREERDAEGKVGETWRVEYALELITSEREDAKGKGKGKFRMGSKPLVEKSTLYPFSVRAIPSGQTVPPLKPIPSELKEFKSLFKGHEERSRWMLKPDYEALFLLDIVVASVELRTSAFPPSSTNPSTRLHYHARVSFGTHHYPAVTHFLSLLSSQPSFAVFSLTREVTLLGPHVEDGFGVPIKRFTERVRVREVRGGEGGSKRAKKGSLEAENRKGEVKCEMRMVGPFGERGSRAEEVFLAFEGDLEIEEEVERVRTCRVEVRYDLHAVVYLAPTIERISFTSTNLHLDIPPRSLPASSPEVEVDSNHFPSLAALYGGSNLATSRSSSAPPEAGPSRLPVRAGEVEAAPPAYAVPSSGTVPAGPAPPTYTGRSRTPPSSSSSARTLPFPSAPAAASSSNPLSFSASPPSAAEEPPELPPTWEETVQDDMLDDWVAASVVYGEDEGEGGREGKRG